MIRHEFEAGMHLRVVREVRPAIGTLLYIHGLGESALSFERLMVDRRLTAWDHLAPDLPGCGKSPWHLAPMGLEGFADHLTGWIGSRPEETFVLVGHSMGGVVGTFLAERLGGRVRGFVNIEGNISEEDCTFSARAAEWTADEFAREGHARLLGEVYRGGRDREDLRVYYPSLRLADPHQYHLNSLELVEVSREHTLAPRMAALACPGIYLLGDPGGTGTYSRSLLTAVGVSWTAIPHAGHWVYLDQPDRFTEALAAFLDRL